MTFFQKSVFSLGFWLLVSLPTVAQLTINYPIPRMVVQRNQDNTAPLYIAGTFSIPVDRIETRLVPISTSSKWSFDWIVLQDQPQQGLFQGRITAPAGSFRLEVRGIRDERIVSNAFVSNVGVGEVFLVAGQSNAMGIPNLGAKGASERVVSFNAWNRFWNKDNVLESSDKPFPVPSFSQLNASNLVFPTGETAWCWGELGDHIADRYNVPVAFFNVAIPATVALNWSCTADGIPAKNIFTSTIWPFLQPYSNLRNTLQYYHSQFGLRAVLWHHGESDAVPLQTSMNDYRQYVQHTIDRSRADFGRMITWVVARCSITPAGPTPDPDIVEAQTSLAEAPNNHVWKGPYTDSIQSPRQPHGHFENIKNGVQGISKFADSWNQNMTDAFFRESLPQQPQQFIRTGLVPSEIPAGTLLDVPYEMVDYTTNPVVAVQLLNDQGQFVTEVGRGKGNRSIRVFIPDTLSRGQYQLRVVATSPMLPGTPSQTFRVIGQSGYIRPFIDIQTEQIDSSTHIYWLTAQEPLGSHFFVERRDSADVYHAIGEVDALTDGQLSHLYSFKDPTKNLGENNYRIRMEQPNGQAQFSNDFVLGVVHESLPHPTIYPNPTDGASLTINLPRSGQWTLALVNLTGQTVWQQSINALTNHPLTVALMSGLPTGLYSLHLQLADQYFTKSLLIQR